MVRLCVPKRGLSQARNGRVIDHMHRLDQLFYKSTAFSVIALVLLVLWLRKERYPILLIGALFLSVLGWSVYGFRKAKAIKSAAIYGKPIPLENYYGKQDCILHVRGDFTYEVTQGEEVIKTGQWVIEPESDILILDGELFGTGMFTPK